MSVRKWAIWAGVYGLISIAFSVTFFITQNPVFTVIAWLFTMCEIFSVIRIIVCARKEDNAANNL